MAAVDDGELVFYPAYCFRASPTHFAWVKMGAIDVHLLKRSAEFEDQSTFFYLNHPVRFVSIVGIIVARTEYPALTILAVDDSSGATIDVIVYKVPVTDDDDNQSARSGKDNRAGDLQSAYATKHVAATNKTALDATALVPGTVVRVKGTLSMFRGTMQVQLERVSVIHDTNTEMRFLDQRSRHLVEVLSVPWRLTEEEMVKLRYEADEEEERLEEEQEKIKRRQRRRIEREEKDQRRIQKLWEREEKQRAKEALYCRDAGARFMRDFKERKV